MAVDMFIKIGDIEGESKDTTHEGEIDVISWNWGLSQAGTFHTGGGGGAGKASVQDLVITKKVDKASPILMQSCCKGSHIEEIVLTVRKAGDDPLEYLILTLTKAMVTSVSASAPSGDSDIMEDVTLNFAEFKVAYEAQDDTGAGAGGVEFAWSVEKNTEA